MKTLLALPPDWNSYAARQIDFAAVSGAVEILVAVMDDRTPLPTFVPVATGGVLLEWHTNVADLEVTVTPNGRAHVYFELVGAQPIELDGLTQEVMGPVKAALQAI